MGCRGHKFVHLTKGREEALGVKGRKVMLVERGRGGPSAEQRREACTSVCCFFLLTGG